MTVRKKPLMLYLVLIIVGVLLLSCIYAYATENVDEPSSIEAFVKIQCDAARIGFCVGDESILPQVYASVESHKLIESENRADNKTREDILSREATYNYAVKNGFGITEEELFKNLRLLVSEIKEGEEYTEIERYYNANGTSLEENVFDNYRFYETEFVINNMYVFYKNSYYEGNTELSGCEYDGWMSYWEAIENKAYLEFIKTDDCATMREAIDTSIVFSQSKYIETLIKDDISDDDLLEIVEDTSVYDRLSYEHNEIIGE